MAFLKKGFKVFGLHDVQTKHKAFDTTHAAASSGDTNLVDGTINPRKKCVPAGAVVTFETAGASYVMISATAGDITNANINSTVFVLAEDCYAEDGDFVYWYVDDVANLEDR